MTREEAINHIKYGLIENNYPLPKELGIEVLQMAIEALKMVEDFERTQIITGGRLNGRTFAYKRGLEDGKSKALEQEPEESADVVEREKIDKAIKEMKLEYLKYDANANKLLADYWMGKAIKILKRNIGESEE